MITVYCMTMGVNQQYLTCHYHDTKLIILLLFYVAFTMKFLIFVCVMFFNPARWLVRIPALLAHLLQYTYLMDACFFVFLLGGCRLKGDNTHIMVGLRTNLTKPRVCLIVVFWSLSSE